MTLFSSLSPGEIADEKIWKLFSRFYMFNDDADTEAGNTTLLKDVIIQSTLVIVIEAVGKLLDVVSQSFYKELECYSKVRLSFFRELHDKTGKFIDELTAV